MTYLYHVTDAKGRSGLLEDQKFFDARSCGWEYMWQAYEWAKMEAQEKKRDMFIMRVRVDTYKRDPKFSYAVIENKDISWIETAGEVLLSNL
jgi:hypothetical protein